MQYIVIEHLHDGNPAPVYARFRAKGRVAPAGLTYVSSWVTDDLTRCYQIMECADRALLDEWMQAWADIVECEVVPVIGSPDAAARVPTP